MPNTELLDRATELFSAKVVKDGMDPKTMMVLASFYLLKRYQVEVVKGDEDFYESLKEDIGAEALGLLERFVAEGRLELADVKI